MRRFSKAGSVALEASGDGEAPVTGTRSAAGSAAPRGL